MIKHPAFSGLYYSAYLSGFSGAVVGLVKHRNDSIKIIRKASSDPSGSARLKEQARLQRSLAARMYPEVLVPSVLDEGVAGGCYWYDMDHVVGIDAVEFLSSGQREDVTLFCTHMKRALAKLYAITPEGELDATIDLSHSINEKLDEIDLRTREKYVNLTDRIRGTIPTQTKLLNPTIVHGDMTLENIILDRTGKMWLIDTIPSPFLHYWIDVSKLFQDLEGRWFLNRGRAIPVAVTRFLSEALMQFAHKLEPDYVQWHKAMLALTFARILPYSKSAEDTHFISSRIENAVMAEPTVEGNL